MSESLVWGQFADQSLLFRSECLVRELARPTGKACRDKAAKDYLHKTSRLKQDAGETHDESLGLETASIKLVSCGDTSKAYKRPCWEKSMATARLVAVPYMQPVAP